MDAVRQLILDRVEALDANLSDLSKKMGRNHAYLQQFLNRGVPRNLPEDVRPALAKLLNVSEADLNSKKLAAPVNRSETLPESGIARARSAVPLSQSNLEGASIPGAELVGQADLPVFGTAQGGRGALILTNDPVDRVVRPDPLLRVKDGYGMIVTGDSMSPEAKSGSIALVNPHLPPRAGDTCVFRRVEDDGTELACIKELRRFTDAVWFVRQHNPKRDYTLKRSEWQICHVVVANYGRR